MRRVTETDHSPINVIDFIRDSNMRFAEGRIVQLLYETQFCGERIRQQKLNQIIWYAERLKQEYAERDKVSPQR